MPGLRSQHSSTGLASPGAGSCVDMSYRNVINSTTAPGEDDPPEESQSSVASDSDMDIGRDADGMRVVVICACVMCALLFTYIVGRYIRQRMRRPDQEHEQRDQDQAGIELPRMVTMYEAVPDEGPTISDGPVVVLSLGNDPQARTLAVGLPEI